MELVFQVWRRYASYASRDAMIRKLTGQEIGSWEHRMGQDIERARKQNDTRRMWALLWILGGTGRKTRKRNTRDVKREDPTIEEWTAAMRKSGVQGGVRPRR